jgi:hypothetical protein
MHAHALQCSASYLLGVVYADIRDMGYEKSGSVKLCGVYERS